MFILIELIHDFLGSNLPNESDDNLNLRRLKPDDSLVIPPGGSSRRKSPFRMHANEHLPCVSDMFSILGLKSNRQNDLHRYDEYFGESFFTSLLIFILCIVVVYLILHNKNKVIAYCEQTNVNRLRLFFFSHRYWG